MKVEYNTIIECIEVYACASNVEGYNVRASTCLLRIPLASSGAFGSYIRYAIQLRLIDHRGMPLCACVIYWA